VPFGKLFFWRLLILFGRAVKPDATPAEVDAVVNDTSGAGGQIFAQAVRFFLVDLRLSACVLTTAP
jgi:hypothetical protein